MPTNYNFTENNTLISFDEAFIRAEQFRNTSYLWGLNNSYQLGDNTTAYRSTPRQEFTSSTNWKQVQGNYFNTAAIKTDGTLWVWGDNLYGQIGDNTTTDRRTPRQEFTSSTNWKQVSSGHRYTAAIKTDGTLWSWGDNASGQIGDNSATDRRTPRQEFTSSTNWKQVTCGNVHTAAIKTDGTLWLWGRNADSSQIGDNTTTTRSTPRQEFTSSTNWKQVSSGGYHTAAIKTDGTLWVWGRNVEGQLGDNTTATRSTPRQEFTSSTNWKQVSGGGYHTAAIKTDGTLWLWGDNIRGQLGINAFGAATGRTTPIQEFTSSTNWKQVACGDEHTAAIKTDGTLWVWGGNIVGQIGDNTRTNRLTPKQEFTSSTNWKQVECGALHTLIIKAEDYPILY